MRTARSQLGVSLMHNDPKLAQIQRFYSNIQLKLSSTSNPSLQESFSEFGMTIGGLAVSSTPVHMIIAPLDWLMHAKEYGNGGEVTKLDATEVTVCSYWRTHWSSP